MGITTEHVYGRQSKFYVSPEAAAGTFEKPVATDSMRILKAEIDPKPDRKDEVTSYMASRNVTSRTQGRTDCPWSVDAEYIPSGTKSVAPQCGQLIKAMLGTETAGANDVTYSQSSSQTLLTLSLIHQIGWMQKIMWGCVPDKMTAKFASGQTPRVHWEGKAMGYAIGGYSVLDTPCSGAITLTADGGGGTTTITSAGHGLTNGDSVTISGTVNTNGTFTVSAVGADTFKVTDAFVGEELVGTWKSAHFHVATAYDYAHMVNNVVQIGTDDNSGAGFQVTATDDAGQFTIEAVAAGLDAVNVIPFVPTWTPLGTPMTGLNGTLTWDSGSLVGPCTAFDLSIESGNTMVDDAAFQEFMSDSIAGIFNITGQLAMRVRKSELLKILDRESYTAKAVALTSGGAAQSGTRLEISLPYCEQVHASFEVPESAEVTITMPFKAMDSAGNDALTWKHT